MKPSKKAGLDHFSQKLLLNRMRYPKKIFLWVLIFSSVLVGSLQAQQSAMTCSMTNVPMINGSNTPLTATITQTASTTGLSSWGLSAPNAIDNNLTNAATANIVLSGSATIRVTDATNNYNAGNFAGFVLQSGLLNLSALGSLTLSTYLDGTLQESIGGGNLIALESGLVSGAIEVGFYTNKPFDAIQLSISAGLGVGSYNIYYAFMRGTGSCTAASLDCNTNTSLSFPEQSAVVSPLHTGVSGISLSALTDMENVVDGDNSTSATIVTTAAVAGSVSISVKKTTGQYDAGSFAGFDIANGSLLGLSLLNNITITTYQDDVEQETFSGSGLLLSGGLLVGTGRQTVGAITTEDFDEIQFTINQGASIDVGTTSVFGAVVMNTCATTLECDQSYALTQDQFPAIINAERSGISGAACVNCTVENTNNVVDNDIDNYAEINMLAGVGSTGSISVLDADNVFPIGTFAGFNLESLSSIVYADLLNSITVTTYLNGVQQESITASSLLNLTLLIDIFGPPSGDRYNLGFYATKEFNEVRISVASLASVINRVAVYGAFIDTRQSEGPCALPVEYGAISAIFKNGQLVINWEALSEKNVKEYEIQASSDGKNWKTIQTISSKAPDGNSDTTLEYSVAIDISSAVLGGIGLLALLITPVVSKRWLRWSLLVIAVTGILYSCTKQDKEIPNSDKDIYLRIVQKDIDGATHVSKVFKPVRK